MSSNFLNPNINHQNQNESTKDNYHKNESLPYPINNLTLDEIFSELMLQSSKINSQKNQIPQNRNFFSVENLKIENDQIINLSNFENIFTTRSNLI